MKLSQVNNKRILYASLDWGFGHVSRSIGVIRKLLSQDNDVVVMCTSEQRAVFFSYLENAVQYEELAPTNWQFKGDGKFRLELVRNASKLYKSILSNKRSTKNFVQKHRIDLVLSDHHYGVRTPSIPSVFITHQIRLPEKSGWFAQRIHRYFLKKFHSIWVMDDGRNLGGCLSSSIGNLELIGHFSRFESNIVTSESAGIVGIISGPEPYSQHLFETIVAYARRNHQKVKLISPKEYDLGEASSFVEVIINDWRKADDSIRNARLIISRTGYSTLMDLLVLKKKAILIPTPGQLEQEYLAELHKGNEDWDIIVVGTSRTCGMYLQQ